MGQSHEQSLPTFAREICSIEVKKVVSGNTQFLIFLKYSFELYYFKCDFYMGVKLVLPLCLESHLFCDRGLRVFPPYAKTSHICQFSSANVLLLSWNANGKNKLFSRIFFSFQKTIRSEALAVHTAVQDLAVVAFVYG